MTYSSNDTSKGAPKQAILTLSPEETAQFEFGTPIIKRTSFRRGIMDITVQKKIVCPTLTTKMFLKRCMEGKPKIEGADKWTVAQALEFVKGMQGIAFFYDIRADLEHFVREIGGEVPISELI